MKKKISFGLSLSFLLLLSIFVPAWAEETKAEQASSKEILNDLEKKTGIKVKIFDSEGF